MTTLKTILGVTEGVVLILIGLAAAGLWLQYLITPSIDGASTALFATVIAALLTVGVVVKDAITA